MNNRIGPIVRHEWNFASNVLNNLFVRNTTSHPLAVWPDWAIYWTLGEFLNTLATINLSKSPTFLGNFCKHVEIFHFTREIIFGQLLQTFGDFYWSHCCGATDLSLSSSVYAISLWLSLCLILCSRVPTQVLNTHNPLLRSNLSFSFTQSQRDQILV